MTTTVVTRAAPRLGVAGVILTALAAIVAIAVAHLTQGTSSIGAFDLLNPDEEAMRVLLASRLPRLFAGVAVGLALGTSGALLQAISRNPLASPDTLAVSSGAYLTVVGAAAFGLSLPALPSGGLAFLGGLAAAGLVMAVSAGGRGGTTRLILAGSAAALAITALTNLLMILFQQETTGLFAWGSGSLTQKDLSVVTQFAPLIAFGLVAGVVLGPRLDVLGLGDDGATVLGVNVRRLRFWVTLLAVLTATAAVVIAGPVGFVGLCAPVIVRLAGRWLPGLLAHRVLIPMSGLAGVLVVLLSDVLLRAFFGGQWGVEVPPGVVTALAGSGVMIYLARRHRDGGPARRPPGIRAAAHRSRTGFWVLVASGTGLLIAALVLGMLAGDTFLRTGDVGLWLQGRTNMGITFVLDQRYPRVLAAMLAGAALAVAGTVIQAVSRNPLAEPGVLGITSGAGVGAVSIISFAPAAGLWGVTGAAGLGALVSFALVYGLAWKGGLSSDRLVLMGFAVASAGTALTVLIIVQTDPYDTATALTWLSGSTYGRTPPQLLPVAIALVVVVPLAIAQRRELDLLSLDEHTPRILGVPMEPARLTALAGAVLLTATAVSAIGVVGFVGLVAPHAARALVGGRHARILPVAALLGALLVSLSDTLGRTVIAPAQIPAGLVTAMLGTPYFVWLLWRSRAGQES
ncbi:iron-hydroxamate transporter permease subunit [Acrocarpospora phusangensis]|uniref:Iron-hydroxamate transporter permease subunit n=1 Tax=Acrocarpospora phusangensis TaxID=1070424 RepID=A0A919QDI6_9ACTN|nr:iron ABC transporter permease [Acrocarpospora phusangensis]GIH24595.1 iron-hydroxamate transporter permease subunit [Acrocarpospora phusangensis]